MYLLRNDRVNIVAGYRNIPSGYKYDCTMVNSKIVSCSENSYFETVYCITDTPDLWDDCMPVVARGFDYVCLGSCDTVEVKSCQSLQTYNQSIGAGFRLKNSNGVSTSSTCFSALEEAVSASVIVDEDIYYCINCNAFDACNEPIHF